MRSVILKKQQATVYTTIVSAHSCPVSSLRLLQCVGGGNCSTGRQTDGGQPMTVQIQFCNFYYILLKAINLEYCLALKGYT